MRTKKLLTFILGMALMIGGAIDLHAQPITNANLPYFCGFENPAENALWKTLAPSGANYVNRWVVGTAVANKDAHALYISADNGVTAGYSANSGQQGSTIAYRELLLAPGQYQVDFDWLALGKDQDQMRVAWVHSTAQDVHDFVTNNAAISSTFTPFQKGVVMSGFGMWQHSTFNVAAGTDTCKLIFLWVNSQVGANPPGGCIDNVQITKINDPSYCSRPTNVSFTPTTASKGVLTWTGGASSYDILYTSTTDPTWHSKTGITQNYDTISGLKKGIYTFWVRSHCGNDSSNWVVLGQQLIYTSLAACLDYVDLAGSHVTCTTGWYGPNTHNPYAVVGPPVDFGYNDIRSSHTICLNIGAYDERTAFGLKMVPDGEVASVRLGNWEDDYGAESITYNYFVDSAASILLMKYAVVLDDPITGHTDSAMPRFKLEILDAQDRIIDPLCGKADFVPSPATRADWNANKWETENILWKDWTMLGLNLEPLAGQNIKIRFTINDCDQGAHFGYAYFSIDCALAAIDGESCGGKQTVVEAPEGFGYKWYPENDPSNIVSTDREYETLPNDTNDYICEVYFLENPACFFHLKAKVKPRFPIAQATYSWAPEDCTNGIQMQNTSYVSIDNKPTAEKCDEFEWFVNNVSVSTEEHPRLPISDLGGTYNITLVASMAGECADTTEYIVHVPRIESTENKSVMTICEGQSYHWRGKTFYTDTIINDTIPNWYGCDSIMALNLTVLDKFKIEIDTTICNGERVWFEDEYLSTPGSYTKNLVTQTGCDSMVTMAVSVMPTVNVVEQPIPTICADDPNITFWFDASPLPMETVPTHFEVLFDNKAQTKGNFVDFTGVFASNVAPFGIVIPMPASVYPDRYNATIIFKDSLHSCGDFSKAMTFDVYYPDSIMVQKWGNVLSLRNSAYNGGFEFAGYQWYRNGNALIGENRSQLYLGVGNTFIPGDEYYVEITRLDGSKMFTCPIITRQANTPITIYPTVIDAFGSIRIYTDKGGLAHFWTTTGILVRSQSFTPNSQVSAPAQIGIYLMNVELEDGNNEVFKVIVKD